VTADQRDLDRALTNQRYRIAEKIQYEVDQLPASLFRAGLIEARAIILDVGSDHTKPLSVCRCDRCKDQRAKIITETIEQSVELINKWARQLDLKVSDIAELVEMIEGQNA